MRLSPVVGAGEAACRIRMFFATLLRVEFAVVWFAVTFVAISG